MVGRDRAVLGELAATLGSRVVPAIVTGVDFRADVVAIYAATGDRGGALDLLGRAATTASTLATPRSLKRGGVSCS